MRKPVLSLSGMSLRLVKVTRHQIARGYRFMNEMKNRNGKPSDISQLLQSGKSAWLQFGKPIILTN